MPEEMAPELEYLSGMPTYGEDLAADFPGTMPQGDEQPAGFQTSDEPLGD